ncbi:MAG TPA: MATE family efflux transporter [Candidatus Izemoplasmatales bacterium]|nr:MATE family efflux transporter [Candidatus Izemoplasmatales bacterium]
MKPELEKKTHKILYENPIWKGLLSLSVPVFFVNILKTLHDVVDGIFLGQVPDVNGFSVSTSMQSAVALSWPVYFVFLSFGMGLSVGGNSLIAQYIGNKDKDSAQKYALNTIFMSVILGVLFTVLVYFTAPLIFRFMGAEGTDYEYAVTYMQIRSFEFPVLFLAFAFQAVRQATGDTVTPVVISAFSIIVNIILTPIMILAWNMGIVGAGVSTLVAQWLAFPFIIYFFAKAKKGIRIKWNPKDIHSQTLKDIFKIAIPASTGQSIQALGFVIMNSLIYSFGTSVSAAFYIGNRINSLVMFPASSVSSIVAIYIAQNVGAGNIPRAKKAVRSGMIMGILMMSVGAMLIIPFRTFLVSLFNHDPDTIAQAAEYTFYINVGLPLMAIFQTYLSTFQGSGETKFAFLMAVIRLWVIRLPLILVVINFTDLGPAGIWYSMLISNIIIVFVGMFLYSRVRFMPKIRINPIAEEQQEQEEVL